MDVDVFIPCFVDQLEPEIGKNLVKILEHVGCKVHYNPQQTCCGQPQFNSGYMKESRELAQKFLNDFAGERYIVSPGGSCTGFIKRRYASLFENENDKKAAVQLSNRLFDICDFLVNVLKIEDLGATFNAKVTVHDSCSALREYGMTTEPRTLLQHVKGLEIVEMEESTTCCGFGGTFSLKQKEISSAMVEQKVRFAQETGAEYITGTEYSCLMNIKAYIDRNNISLKPIHIVNILSHF
ncbi:MAG: (Fe-S)-binding protein [Bacteroidales bacterium]|nr:(Fe-S)-binding protein [Bacteroidales bacterium]